MFHKSVFAWALAASLIPVGAAHAGMYAQDLARCMVSHITKQDKAVAAHFIFTALANNPAVKSMAQITDEQQKNAVQGYNSLIVKSLTVTCRTESLAAIKYEGQEAISSAFSMYMAVTGRMLFSDPAVVKAMSGVDELCKDKDLKALSDEALGTKDAPDQATDSTAPQKAPPAG